MSELRYVTSRNYERLEALLRDGWQIVDPHGAVFRRRVERYADGSEAVTYFYTGDDGLPPESRDEFLAMCHENEVEFLDPELPVWQAARIEELEEALRQLQDLIPRRCEDDTIENWARDIIDKALGEENHE